MNKESKGWVFSTNSFDPVSQAKEESWFTVANGTIGMRGNMEEELSEDVSKIGTYINGFYERSTIPYGETAYGYARTNETMLNVADAKKWKLSVGNEVFNLLTSSYSDYHRQVDMRDGILHRSLIWNTVSGASIRIETSRMASMEQKELVVFGLKATLLKGEALLKITSGLDGNVHTGEESDDPRVAGGLNDGAYFVTETKGMDNVLTLTQMTKNSHLAVTAAETVSFMSKNETFQVATKDTSILWNSEIDLKENSPIEIVRYVVYKTGREEDEAKIKDCAISEARAAKNLGLAALEEKQKDFYHRFWERADIAVLDDPIMTLSMRFNVFHILQSTGRDGRTSIAAKGLSGEGYGGHYFWESEAYIMTLFLYTRPEIARELLVYRHSILDKAREQARLLGHENGALYSWRSITGSECSAFFPGGSSQYHINGDISLGVAKYMDATKDVQFLGDHGLEILLETARLWCCVGFFNPRRNGQFCIDEVTGPDEYTALVNNNYYTNIMARENLWNAVKWGKWLMEKDPEKFEALKNKIKFSLDEFETFQKAGDAMYLPYDETLKIHKQDDTFLDKKPLDLSKIPPENHPLLNHYHPMFIYRHQVLKQADLLQAAYNLPQYFDREDLIRDYDYYEKVTTHDSSLSSSVYSIMAAANGNKEKAFQYFIQTVRTDLDDNQGNTKDGLHMANMAGAWLCIVQGFAGMRVVNGELLFAPICPDEWKGYKFSVTFNNRKPIFVTVDSNETVYRMEEGEEPLQIRHHGRAVVLQAGENHLSN